MARIAQLRSCKHCGQTGLMWKNTKGPRGESIRLVSPVTGLVHYCNEYYNQRPRHGQKQPPFNPVQPPDVQPPVVQPEVIEPEPEITPNPVVVIPEEKQPKIEPAWDGKHKSFATLLRRCRIRLNTLLVGPAGSGKTLGAFHVHEALGLPFYPFSVGPQTSKSDLLGYIDANGKLVRTVLREAYEHGGVFLLDELDAGNPGVLTILNAILANQVVAFPDGVITKHPDFICIAAANTFGRGANRQYVGRQALDAATLDRFVTIFWDYDERLEAHLGAENESWTLYVWQLRKAAERTGIKAIFGTRRIMQGIAMLKDGESLTVVQDDTVFSGVSEDDRRKLIANL